MSWAITATATIAVGSAVVADRRAGKVEKAQEEQADVERAIGNEKTARARRTERAKAQVAGASIENAAAASGQTTSSAAIAGGQSVNAQAADNLATINQRQGESNLLSGAAQNVADASRVGVGEVLVGQVGTAAAGALGKKAGEFMA
jgi:hypothetical protein